MGQDYELYDYELYRDYAFIFTNGVMYKADLHFEAALDILKENDKGFNRESYLDYDDARLVSMSGDNIITGEKATIGLTEMLITYTEKNKERILKEIPENTLPVYTDDEVEKLFLQST